MPHQISTARIEGRTGAAPLDAAHGTRSTAALPMTGREPGIRPSVIAPPAGAGLVERIADEHRARTPRVTARGREVAERGRAGVGARAEASPSSVCHEDRGRLLRGLYGRIRDGDAS